jgi:hypothetical protein
MSAEREADDGLDEGLEPETETEEPDESSESGADEGEEEEEEESGKKAKELEKRVHNHVGQVARERSRRRAAEARAQEYEARIAELERRTGGQTREDELLALIGALPDTEDDPVGDIANLKRALKLYRAREVEQYGQAEQQRALEHQVTKLRSAMSESEEDFATDHADYYDAATFYRKARTEELRDAGYSGRYLDQKLADDLFGVVRMSLESGQDPAERVYALAAKRGFRAGGKAADRNLDKLKSATETGVRPVGRQTGGTLSWGDVAKLDGPQRDKAWAKLRARETARRSQ